MDRLQALATALCEARARANFSQEQLAALAGIHRNVVGRIERNLITPTIPTLFALADALGVPAATIMARVEELTAESQDEGRS